MRQKSLLKSLLLLCLLVVGVSNAWADVVTFDPTTDIGSGTSVTKGGITISTSNGTMANGTDYRPYSGATLTFESTVGNITRIEFTSGGGSKAKCSDLGDPDVGSWTSTSTSGTWTGDAATIVFASSSAQVRISSISVTYTSSGGSSTTETVATPTFSPAAGTFTSAQNVTISTETSGATIYYTTDGNAPTTSSNVYSTAIPVSQTTTIKAMAVKDGMNNSAVATATYTINLPYSGADYVRVSSVDNLTDGAKVIIAARHNSTATSYYAMSATTTGKPTGVAFTSTTSNNNEVLPSSILNDENTYCWTVGVTENGYTFTNASNKSLGYSSSTDFTNDGNNNEWTITRATSPGGAMVNSYEGFYIVNKNNTGRAVALNNQHNFGPYSTNNTNSATYNFYLDIFVQGATTASTPTITADDVNITYDATNGSISYSISNEPDPAGTLAAAVVTADTNIASFALGTITGSTVPFTCAANTTGTARTAKVTLTYSYGDNESVTKNVIVTQAGDPNAVMTISEVRTQGTGSVVTKGVVTSVNGKTAYMQDNSAAIAVYNSAENLTVAVGDEIKVEGTLGTYNGLLQIQSPTITTLSQNNTVTPEVMTIAEVNASTKQGWLVRVENATVTAIDSQNTTIAQGENTIVVRGITGVEYTVNDVITLTANIGCYNTAQLANPTNVSVQANTDPVINASNVNIAYNATSGEIEYEIANPTTGVTLGATTDADWVSNIAVGATSITFDVTENDGNADRTATFTLTYTGAENKTVTVTQGHYVPDFATLPFEYDGGKAGIATTAGLSENGLGSDYNSSPKLKFDETGDYVILKFNERPGTLTFDVKGNTFSGGTFKVQTSVDGVTYSDLETYTDLTSTVQNESFGNLGENVRYIKWIYTNKSSGNVALGNIALAAYNATPSITVDPNTVNATAAETEGTITVTYSNIADVDAEVLFYAQDGETSATYDWIDAEINSGNNVYYLIEANDGAARTAYMKVHQKNSEVYSELITISQAAYVAPAQPGNWELTSLDEITENDVFVIVGNNGDNYAMSNDKGTTSAPAAVGVTVTDDILSVSGTSPIADNLKWNLKFGKDGYMFYPDGVTDNYLYCTNTNNGLRVGTGDAKHFTVAGNGYLTTTETTNQRYLGIYSSQDWRCYTNTTGNIASQTFGFYKELVDRVTFTVKANFPATTFSCSQPLDLSTLSGAKAYIITDENGTTEQVTGSVPANTGLYIEVNQTSDTDQTFTIDVATSGTAPSGNILEAITKSGSYKSDGNKTYYAYGKKGTSGYAFYKVKTGTVGLSVVAGKALLACAGSSAKEFIEVNGGATGISTIDNSQSTIDNCYDLSGRRVAQPTQKGIYVVNGKKVVIK